MTEFDIILRFKSNERDEERLAALVARISAAMNPDAFELRINSTGKLATAAEQSNKADDREAKDQPKDKTKKNPRRPMGELKRTVFEGLERQRDRFLSLKECGLACGLTAAKIKSTINEAYSKGEVKREQANGVYVYQLTSVGLALLEADRKLRASSGAKAAA